MLDWIHEARYDLFRQTRLAHEYRLCCQLQKVHFSFGLKDECTLLFAVWYVVVIIINVFLFVIVVVHLLLCIIIIITITINTTTLKTVMIIMIEVNPDFGHFLVDTFVYFFII